MKRRYVLIAVTLAVATTQPALSQVKIPVDNSVDMRAPEGRQNPAADTTGPTHPTISQSDTAKGECPATGCPNPPVPTPPPAIPSQIPPPTQCTGTICR